MHASTAKWPHSVLIVFAGFSQKIESFEHAQVRKMQTKIRYLAEMKRTGLTMGGGGVQFISRPQSPRRGQGGPEGGSIFFWFGGIFELPISFGAF